MPDVTMCVAKRCPLSTTCYRHKDSGTQPSYSQSFGDFSTACVLGSTYDFLISTSSATEERDWWTR
jgi:hypothetical protein